jgi:2-octaprenyl-6-methoxyphenol hydroxylase
LRVQDAGLAFMRKSYQVVIVGAGLAGTALACALRGQGLRLALLDAGDVLTGSSGQAGDAGYDARAIALAYGSRRFLEAIGLWDALAQDATPIRRVHVSEREGFGFTRMDAVSLGVDALGYVVEARVLGPVLRGSLVRAGGIDVIAPARVVSFDADAGQIQVVTGAGPERLSSSLVVAADGVESDLRQWVEIPTDRSDYRQTAVVTTVSSERPHQGVAYERFTVVGPMALLPLAGDRCALVWCVRADEAPRLTALSDGDFLGVLGETFGGRLGRFLRVGSRHSYPLEMVRAREQVRDRLVLLGNAAHALHPVAAQGFNLTLRDVAVLAESILEAVRKGRDPGELSRLQRYERQRRGDQARVAAFTDGVTRLFSNDLGPLRIARNLGLVALDMLPRVKDHLARHAMGLSGRMPKLPRRLALD